MSSNYKSRFVHLSLKNNISTPLHILQKYWGHQSFRDTQEDIIHAVLQGNDVLALLPTGGGKSVCFQVPALLMEGLCIVVSPLIALMKDQVQHLQEKGIAAETIHSALSREELEDILYDAEKGNIKFLYISPERIDTPLFQQFMESANISLIAVDEAHCISQWGYDFRPSYLRIARLRYHFKNIPVIALTASATEIVQKDIIEKLYFGKYSIFRKSFERPNLSYSVFHVENKLTKLAEVLRNVPGTAIVYCKSRRLTQDVSNYLKAKGFNTDYYHAGLDATLRTKKQEQWMNGEVQIIVCTNAFGMGIDKPDVRVVAHYDTPDCLENYYQEAGRAGRDGKKSYAVLLYTTKDIEELKTLPDIRFPDFEIIKKVYGHIGDYLQLPESSGEGESFNFNFNVFAENFKLDPLQTIYAIKAIEQQGHIQYNESIFLSSKVQFTTDRDNVEAFEDANEKLEPLIKTLLRTYEGIFSKNVSVNETRLAHKLKMSETEVKKQLYSLHSQGIIHYTPQKDSPQIYFLMNRATPKYMYFNHEEYAQKRKIFEERLKVMINYTQIDKTCRSAYISRYFGDRMAKDCGICDNCLKRKKKQLSSEKFKLLSDEMLASLQTTAFTTVELETMYKKYGKADVWQVIHFLISEEKITMSSDGKLLIK